MGARDRGSGGEGPHGGGGDGRTRWWRLWQPRRGGDATWWCNGGVEGSGDVFSPSTQVIRGLWALSAKSRGRPRRLLWHSSSSPDRPRKGKGRKPTVASAAATFSSTCRRLGGSGSMRPLVKVGRVAAATEERVRKGGKNRRLRLHLVNTAA